MASSLNSKTLRPTRFRPRLEGVVEERGDGLGSVAVVPVLRMPHYDGELRRGVRLADVQRLSTPMGSRSSLRWMAKESSVGECSLSSKSRSTVAGLMGAADQLVRRQISGSAYHAPYSR